ncbi:unnamed protein product [Protopolystoma xenopodis]|uniref:Uncharacterized protein n=1 Tax=Protopolystoma xenopodis TaxID=117903 RepID=A0A3S5ACG7_9PLAT|nr:unnamed protein product [Protopolystoma xenopodis]
MKVVYPTLNSINCPLYVAWSKRMRRHERLTPAVGRAPTNAPLGGRYPKGDQLAGQFTPSAHNLVFPIVPFFRRLNLLSPPFRG